MNAVIDMTSPTPRVTGGIYLKKAQLGFHSGLTARLTIQGTAVTVPIAREDYADDGWYFIGFADGTQLVTFVNLGDRQVTAVFGAPAFGPLFDREKDCGLVVWAMLPGDALRVDDTVIYISRVPGNAVLTVGTAEQCYREVVLPLDTAAQRYKTNVMQLHGI